MYATDDVMDVRIHTMKENVDRFKRYGKVLTRTATKGDEKAKIGQLNETTYIVFYPDGTFDRFEAGPASVTYRPGWTGPNLASTKKSVVVENLEEELKAFEKVIQDPPKKKPAAKKTAKKKVTASPSWAATLEMIAETSVIKEEPVKKPALKKKTTRKSSTLH